MGRLRAQRRAEAEAGPAPAATGLERRAWSLVQRCERPATLAACLAALVLAGLLVRLPHAYDEAAYFTHHADEASYFNKGMELLWTTAGPMAHGGSGLPIFLEGVFKALGREPGGVARQGSASLDNATLEAARLAYLANMLAGTLVVPATYLLAAPLMRPAKALLATALVAFDPFLLFFSGHLMTEQLFTLLVVAAAACVVRARSHPAWLLGMGAALALAGTVRGNGIVILLGLGAFAIALLRGSGARRWTGWLAGAAVAFFVLEAPYLAWRAKYLPSPFDYGTNGRFWADRLWDFSDRYWREGRKETMGDYFSTHSAGDALRRLWSSIQMQVTDLVGGNAGGHRPHPEGAALHGLLAAPLLVAMVAERRRRELWGFGCVAVAAVLSLTWMYWIHDSPRYFAMLVPLAAVTAVEGLAWLGRRIGRPGTLALLYAATFLVLFALLPLADGLAALKHPNPSWGLTFAFLLLGLAATAGPLRAAWAERGRRGGRGDDAGEGAGGDGGGAGAGGSDAP